MRRLMQLCCICLLLFAQQAAFTHAVWHAQQQLPAGHLERDAAHAGHTPGSTDVGLLCAFDATVGQVLGGVLCGMHTMLRTAASAETLHRIAPPAARPDFLAPLSRGPPSPLAS